MLRFQVWAQACKLIPTSKDNLLSGMADECIVVIIQISSNGHFRVCIVYPAFSLVL